MQTRLFSQNLQANECLEIKELLLQGEVIAFPTETVYGLGVDWKNEEAIEKLFVLKKRPKQQPMTLHISSMTFVEQVAVGIPPSFYKLAKQFWPGPLTIVLPKSPMVSSKISEKVTVGVRMPAHPCLLYLIEALGGALLGTSANLSGHTALCRADDVLAQFEGKIAAFIDGGEIAGKKASTVLSLAVLPPRILREGPVSKEAIEQLLGTCIL